MVSLMFQIFAVPSAEHVPKLTPFFSKAQVQILASQITSLGMGVEG